MGTDKTKISNPRESVSSAVSVFKSLGFAASLIEFY